MGRKANELPTEQITISTTHHVVELLRVLVRRGVYGKNSAEVAEELLRGTIRGLMRESEVSEPLTEELSRIVEDAKVAKPERKKSAPAKRQTRVART